MPLKLARLLAVLVALVVPLQGMASVAAGQCMVLGHHQNAGDNSHAHDGDGHDHDAEENAAGAHCGPCTACCASVSIAPLSGVSILPAPAIAQYAVSQFPPIGIEPDGVYRPPLSL